MVKFDHKRTMQNLRCRVGETQRQGQESATVFMFGKLVKVKVAFEDGQVARENGPGPPR